MEKYALITIVYNGFSGRKVQNAILEESFYIEFKEEIGENLEDHFWKYDMDGEHNHVRGEASTSIGTKEEILALIPMSKFELANEVQEIFKWNSNIGFEVSDNIEKALSKLKEK